MSFRPIRKPRAADLGATARESSSMLQADCTWIGASVVGSPKSAEKLQVSKGAVNGDATSVSSTAAKAFRSMGTATSAQASATPASFLKEIARTEERQASKMSPLADHETRVSDTHSNLRIGGRKRSASVPHKASLTRDSPTEMSQV